MTIPAPPIDGPAAALRAALADRVVLADDVEYDTARLPWNRSVDRRPLAVAWPQSAEDVVGIVRAAGSAGLRVMAQSTGHAAGALRGADLSDTVIVDLSRLRGVSVDPDARSARVLGGSTWNDVLAAAAPHGLTALHGSAGDVSVVGYALNGGVSFYVRAHGLAVGSVTEAQVVTAGGALVRAAADENPDLFWALRGGAGSIGIVVSVRLELLPYADVFAGMLLWDAARAAEVAHAWARWTADAPESATTVLRVLHLPPLPELPPFLSGRSVVVIDGAILETDAVASALLEPLRALAPEVDTFARIPAPALIGVHMDPTEPTPSVSAATVLAELPPEAVDAVVEASGMPGMFITELRHLGGAAARPVAGGGAVSSVAGEYVAHAVAVAPVADAVPGAEQAVRAGMARLAPWRSTGVALTFVDEPGTDRAPAFGEGLVRLRELKRALDPNGMLLGAHPI